MKIAPLRFGYAYEIKEVLEKTPTGIKRVESFDGIQRAVTEYCRGTDGAREPLAVFHTSQKGFVQGGPRYYLLRDDEKNPAHKPATAFQQHSLGFKKSPYDLLNRYSDFPQHESRLDQTLKCLRWGFDNRLFEHLAGGPQGDATVLTGDGSNRGGIKNAKLVVVKDSNDKVGYQFSTIA